MFIVNVLVAGWTRPVSAQSDRVIVSVPNGCSVPGANTFVANGLDSIFLGACDRHDHCYGSDNPFSDPCFGVGTKAGCDINFLRDMEGACSLYSSLLAFPLPGWVDSVDFLEDCSLVAGIFYTAVVVGGTNAFRTRQCAEGCTVTCAQS